MKYAILCSGGDGQGMNSVIQSFTYACLKNKITPIAFLEGYKGLINNNYLTLTKEYVDNIHLFGGTKIKTSRCDEFKTTKGTAKAVENLKKDNIDGLVVIGGNGSYIGAERLKDLGIKVICVPATIDNDLFYTENNIGFNTAVSNAVDMIENIKQTASAVNRVMVISLMGRDFGNIALNAGFITNAEVIAIPELKTTIKDVVKGVAKALNEKVDSPIVVMCEGCNFSPEDVMKKIKDELKVDVRIQIGGYIQRGGMPSFVDRKLGKIYGINAVKFLMQGKNGLALGIDKDLFAINLKDANKIKSKVDLDLVEAFKFVDF